jgi:hypothetical protein
MTLVDRIKRRLDKEEAEREVAIAKESPKREVRYRKIEELLRQYDDLCSKTRYTIPEEARFLMGHIQDEYGYDLVFFFSRVRKEQQP